MTRSLRLVGIGYSERQFQPQLIVGRYISDGYTTWESWFTALLFQLIMAEVRKHGTKWTTFVHLLPGRTDQSIKTRYNTILRREQRAAAKAEKAAKEPGGPLLAVGQRVEVNYAEEGGWCKGTITKVRPKLSLYDVEVDNYKREKKVDRCDVRVLKE